MINDYSDPKVTLTQQYAAVTEGISATLGVCVIGPNKRKIFSYEKNEEDIALSNGLQQTLLSTVVVSNTYPQIIKDSYPVVNSKGVSILAIQPIITYDYFRVGNIQSIQGDIFQNSLLSAVQFSQSLTHVSFRYNANSYVVFSGRGKNVQVQPQPGDEIQMLAYTDGEPTNPIQLWARVTGIVQGADGKQSTLVLTIYSGINVQTKIKNGTYSVQHVLLMRTLQKAYVNKESITCSSESVTINRGARISSTQLIGSSFAFTYPIRRAQHLYMEYSDVITDANGQIMQIAARTDAQVQERLGQLTADNPVACAVACACAAADTRIVRYVTIDQETTQEALVNAYGQAMDLIIDNDAIHGVVPCTTNRAVLKNLLNRVIAAANQQIPHFKYIYASTEISQITAANTHEKVVSDIVNGKVFNDKRGLITFADGPKHNGISVPPYCVAAAVAGLRSASYPHAPLSNVILPGIQTTDASGFTYSDLQTLGANGFLRVGLNADGATIIRRQLTSAAKGDVNYDEQSIVCNIDSICLNIKNSGKGYVGNTNISQQLLSILRQELQIRLRNYTLYVNSLIGPQLLTAQVVDLFQHPVHKDWILCTVQGQPPKPFNKFAITFRMI